MKCLIRNYLEEELKPESYINKEGGSDMGSKLFKQLGILLFILAIVIIPYWKNAHFNVTATENKYAKLGKRIEEILNDERLNGATIGVSIRSAKSGEILYDHFGDFRLRPASNMKLLTAAAALETLGEQYQFKTEVLTDGAITGNVLNGNLYLKGKGDPTLLKEDFDHMASELKKKGIHQIRGQLIGDDTWYDQVRLSMDVPWSDESYYYGAQVSALTVSPDSDYDTGTVIVEVIPSSKPDKPAEVKLSPHTNYVNIINKTKTVAKDGKKNITIERLHGVNTILIEGTIPVGGASEKEWIAVDEPTNYALDLFKNSLQEKGIAFIGNGDVKQGKTPNKSTLLVEKKSKPLKEILIPFMKLSNNGHAEMLAKEMGRVVHNDGSWDKGLDVIYSSMSKLGVDSQTLMLRDASGISHVTAVPANEMTKLLYAAQSKSWYPAFLASLPVGGAEERLVGGSLRDRFDKFPVKGNVKAKPGSLSSVTSLSGYVTTKSGEPMIFSIIINNFIATSVIDIEDQIVMEIANDEKRL